MARSMQPFWQRPAPAMTSLSSSFSNPKSEQYSLSQLRPANPSPNPPAGCGIAANFCVCRRAPCLCAAKPALFTACPQRMAAVVRIEVTGPGGSLFVAKSSQFVDCCIPVRPNATPQTKTFGLPDAEALPFTSGSFVCAVSSGASVNCSVSTFATAFVVAVAHSAKHFPTPSCKLVLPMLIKCADVASVHSQQRHPHGRRGSRAAGIADTVRGLDSCILRHRSSIASYRVPHDDQLEHGRLPPREQW